MTKRPACGSTPTSPDERTKNAMIPKYTFKNGISAPMFGIGMDQVNDPNTALESLLYAFSIGYRSVDTAYSYQNEEAVGRAVRTCGLPREELYVTTKLTAADQGYDATLRAFERSLRNLGFDYLDCFLIHWPGKYLYVDTWRAFERLYAEKAVKVIGVCNFNIHHLEKLSAETEIMPMVNQIESHPYFPQNELSRYCQEQGLLVEAWSPLMCGGIVLEDKTVLSVAAECEKSPAQVVLRWHIQKGHRVFPKSVTPTRITQNIDIFDFALSPEQMDRLAMLEKNNFRIGPNPDIFFEL